MTDQPLTAVSRGILPLELRNVSYQAGDKRLVKDVTCQFQAGHRYMVIGPNGAGKTLLLRLCHGLLKPAAGQVRWQEKDKRRVIKGQAMVFQRSVMMRRSAAENIAFALAARNVAKAERRERVEQALFQTGLTRVADRPARVLSLGEQQRLSIARAWALRPEVLFLDEPCASLDPPATHSIEKLLMEISAAGTTLIMTTHDLGQARRLAQDVLFMFRGRLKEFSEAERFFAGPENDLAQAYLKGDLLWWKRRPEEDCVQTQNKPNRT
ncbi:ATP-binding cassette domain-containing protein [Aestuariispira insulae]|uniref:Amino acid ABC transporter ATP-binding protein (PAAT family) n=1 Tax=Aestuariispira insulae TaxID=1461337 RepID=A0A3D9HYG1_9PROT|nr:ATP-binding cassette domain-containing protein [Aestuariispira insulae]RED53946.1 amino acid ABC transporter ATP-binding protein (PAAT family) [Aestuariispira insulae]